MSRFIDKIVTENTGKRYASIDPIKVNIETGYDFSIPKHYTEYMVKVTVGGTCKVDHHKDMPQAKKVLARAIQEEVFGEFRRPLYDLECYLYDRDFDKARECLCSIKETMFKL
jgi:hypothetical protein